MAKIKMQIFSFRIRQPGRIRSKQSYTGSPVVGGGVSRILGKKLGAKTQEANIFVFLLRQKGRKPRGVDHKCEVAVSRKRAETRVKLNIVNIVIIIIKNIPKVYKNRIKVA